MSHDKVIRIARDFASTSLLADQCSGEEHGAVLAVISLLCRYRALLAARSQCLDHAASSCAEWCESCAHESDWRREIESALEGS